MKISIIGASGNVGSAAAFHVATQGVADEIVMIDTPRPDVLKQHVNDLTSAVSHQDVLVRAGADKDMKDSDIVINAAGRGPAGAVKSRLELLPQNIPIIQGICLNVRRYCPEATVIIASNPVCPLNYAMYLCSGLDRHQLIGYSANDSIRFRALMASELGVNTSRVEAFVIGEHGESQVPLFSSVRVDGKKVDINEDIKRKVREQVARIHGELEGQRTATGRTAAWTTAVGLAALCRAIASGAARVYPCSIVLEGEYGVRNMSLSVPVVLGKAGVRDILEWELTPDEREGLDNSIKTLEPAMRYVEEFLGMARNQ
jgi:malate/lactate dehydrogenase